jgi:hypothetical protein
MDQLFLQIECTKFQNKKYNHVQMSNVFMQIPSHQMRFHLMNGCEREPILEPVPPNMHQSKQFVSVCTKKACSATQLIQRFYILLFVIC